MGYFKARSDGLNYEEFRAMDYAPTYLDRHIAELHFYHNLILVKKAGKRAERTANMTHRRLEP